MEGKGLLCAGCAKLALIYSDEVAKTDARLHLIARLLGAAAFSNEDIMDLVPQVAMAIEEYLDQRRAIDHVVFDRSADGGDIDDDVRDAAVRYRRIFGRILADDRDPTSDDSEP